VEARHDRMLRHDPGRRQAERWRGAHATAGSLHDDPPSANRENTKKISESLNVWNPEGSTPLKTAFDVSFHVRV
jgi:hypothetical protein